MFENIIRGWNEMSTYRKIRRVFMIGLALFGVWALTPYLYDRRVDESFPAAAPASQAMAPATMAPAIVDKAAPTAAMSEPVALADQTVPTAAMADTVVMTDQAAPTAATMEPAALADQGAPTVAAAPAGPVALVTGMFIAGSTPGDKADGKATIYRLEDGKPLLRLEDFSTTNGPDLFVVLSSSANPDQDGLKNGAYVQLDALKGNVGNQNYELPADVDLSQYKSVVIWCRTFNIVFGYATLQSAS
jgi:Electron transfer DM13